MGSKRKKVLIFGAGPAGLASGVQLLEKGGQENLDVTIVNLDHILGGKAGSWKDPVFNDGRFYDHGFHFLFGFYRDLPRLMAKAGINKRDVAVSNKGNYYWYEMRDRKLHTFHMTHLQPMNLLRFGMYDGWTISEKINFSQWLVRAAPTMLKKDLSYLDDICFKAWATEKGMSLNFVRTSTTFRFTQDALFNWPYEISAYVAIESGRKIFGVNKGNPFGAFRYKNLEYFMVNDGWSTQIWDPIGEYYKKLGGRFELGRKLVGLQHDGRKITGVEVGQTIGGDGKSAVVPIASGSKKMISDFDYVISAIPMNTFRELNPDDKGIWGKRYFNYMYNLTGIAPIGMFAFFKEDLKVPYRAQINGIEPPLFNAVDYKNICLPYVNNDRFGSVIHMQGQETGFEELSDKETVDLGLDYLSRIKGFERIRNATLQHYYLYRGNRNHSRYLLSDPGTYKFRPTVKSPFENLYIAGDWVQHEAVLPCMEGAVQSGIQAADYILDDCGLG